MKAKPQNQTPVMGVRVPDEVRGALERAADRDARTLSSLVVKILTEWVTAHPELAASDTPEKTSAKRKR